MKLIRQIVGIGLLAVLVGYPATACLVPGAEMTQPERECCKHMAQHCGSMNMPSSHSCCKKDFRQSGPVLRAAAAHLAPPAVVAATFLDAPGVRVTRGRDRLPEQHPPPEGPAASSSILRI